MFCSNFNLSRQVFCVIILAILLGSCTHYYKPVLTNTNTPESTRKVISDNTQKYFILRKGRYIYALSNITVDNTTMTMRASLSKVDPSHLEYLKSKPRKYKYDDESSSVLNEVHIYSKDSSRLNMAEVLILPLDQIEKIELIQHDKKRTSTTNLWIGVGVTIGVAGIIAAIIASAYSNSINSGVSCSCPVVSVYDGDQYSIQGELFTGAINKKIEARDYMMLNIHPVNGEYQLRITNDLNERSYIDYAHLSIIGHDDNRQIGIGTDGKTYLLSDQVSPSFANLNGNKDVLSSVLRTDQKTCSFDDTISNSSANELLLSFQHPGDLQNAKLVLQLRNSSWLAYIYDDYASHYGKRYEAWQKKINNMPAEEILKWIKEQQIPLRISVNTISGWKEVENLNMGGMLANREVVIPLELEARATNPIQVKLSTGFLFWELDYAAVDFTSAGRLTTSTLIPYSALDELGNDVLDVLMHEDGRYLTQTEIGNQVTLKYKLTGTDSLDKSYSVVLMTKGYYELIRAYTGGPDIAFLKKFKAPGALSVYSKEKYKSIYKGQSILSLNSN